MEYFKWNKDAPRKNGARPLGDVIDELLNVYKLRGKLNETQIVDAWPKVMGAAIANRTASTPFIRNQILYVKLTSAPLRQQLSMHKSNIISMLNESVGAEVIRDVIFQ